MAEYTTAPLVIVVGLSGHNAFAHHTDAPLTIVVSMWDDPAGDAPEVPEVRTLYQATPDRLLVDWSIERRGDMSSRIYVKDGERVNVRVNADLTGTTQTVFYREANDEEASVEELDFTVVDAPSGEIELHSETLAAMDYVIEVEVVRDGVPATYPTRGFATLSVGDDLG